MTIRWWGAVRRRCATMLERMERGLGRHSRVTTMGVCAAAYSGGEAVAHQLGPLAHAGGGAGCAVTMAAVGAYYGLEMHLVRDVVNRTCASRWTRIGFLQGYFNAVATVRHVALMAALHAGAIASVPATAVSLLGVGMATWAVAAPPFLLGEFSTQRLVRHSGAQAVVFAGGNLVYQAAVSLSML